MLVFREDFPGWKNSTSRNDVQLKTGAGVVGRNVKYESYGTVFIRNASLAFHFSLI